MRQEIKCVFSAQKVERYQQITQNFTYTAACDNQQNEANSAGNCDENNGKCRQFPRVEQFSVFCRASTNQINMNDL